MKRYGILSLGLFVLLSAVGFAADPAKEEQTGLKAGTKAPAFKLRDQNGKERTLDEFVKDGHKVALVFFRSAEWWPFCIKQLVQLHQASEKFEKAKIRIVGISYDSVEVLDKSAKKQKIAFPLLSDPDHKTIADFGLLNKDAKGKAQGVPYPGTIILDGKGVIRGKAFFDGYRDRHGPDDLLKIADGLK